MTGPNMLVKLSQLLAEVRYMTTTDNDEAIDFIVKATRDKLALMGQEPKEKEDEQRKK